MKVALSWFQIWTNALIHPGNQIFNNHSLTSDVAKRKAYEWVYVAAIGFLLNYFSLNPVPDNVNIGNNIGKSMGLGVFLLFGFVLMTVFIQTIATILGGKAERSDLAYAFATYIAPLGIISGILSFIPFLIVYGFILNIMTTKRIYQFDWLRAIVCNMIVFIVILFCFISFSQFDNRFFG